MNGAPFRHPRYSPVNWLIVDWHHNGVAFDNCGLPEALPCEQECEEEARCLYPVPIQEAIDTYDWERWLPEVIVGIEEPDEEIAANYTRAAAIEFCKGARVLQREVVVELQPDTSVYPVFPYDGEQIIGVIAAKLNDGESCRCSDARGSLPGVDWQFDTARNELYVMGAPGRGLLRLLVWAAPSEDACFHDRFLYDRFRYDISLGARLLYANAVHFRDRALMASLPSGETFAKAIVLAKTKALQVPSATRKQPGSGMWGGGALQRGTNPNYYRRGNR